MAIFLLKFDIRAATKSDFHYSINVDKVFLGKNDPDERVASEPKQLKLLAVKTQTMSWKMLKIAQNAP